MLFSYNYSKNDSENGMSEPETDAGKNIELSIIIVSWNVNELLSRCLASIREYARPYRYEVIVVDNASCDSSAEMVARKYPEVRCIPNSKNRGFAAACNQGIAVSRGAALLFLNPDTVLSDISLPPLLTALHERQTAGMVAPLLLNEDGSVQRSVRRFPNPVRALGEFFHLTRPREVTFDVVTEIDQPMGACMLVRRSVLEKVGVFDERFFIWFEEVDLCRRIRDAGYTIFFIPDATVQHIGGQSFAKRNFFEKQKIFYTSYAAYLWKHFGSWSVVPVFFMKWYAHILHYPFFWVGLFGISLLELTSLVGYFFEPVRTISFFFFTILVFFLSLRRLSFGIMALACELLIGSKGYLLSVSIGETPVSLRMALFGAVMAAWVFYLMRKKRVPLFFQSRFIMWYGILGFFVFYGIVRGVFMQNDLALLFKDVNAWMFFFIAFPLYDAFSVRSEVYRFGQVLCAGILAQLVKVGAVLYIMSHTSFGYDVLYPLYRWIRDTGVGEITRFEWGAVRIFFQSNMYALLFLFAALPFVLTFVRERPLFGCVARHWKMGVLWSACVGIVLLSFSRSFWLAGTVAALGVGVFLLVKRRWRDVITLGAWVLGSTALAAFAILAITLFPLPSATGGMGFDAFANRFRDLDSEAAAASRWSLAPVLFDAIKQQSIFGYGFGKTITYVSYDPRVRELEQSGTFTTYAFEWGWLDMIVKMGIGGALAYLTLLGAFVRVGVMRLRSDDGLIAAGLVVGLAVLALVHVFTPYLNHPLGIAALLGASSVLDFRNDDSSLVSENA